MYIHMCKERILLCIVLKKMTHNIYWIGSNDWTTERFENLFPIPNGVVTIAISSMMKKLAL